MAPAVRARRRWWTALVGAVVLAGAVVAVVLGTGSGRRVRDPRLAAFSLPRLSASGALSADPVRYPLTGALAGRPVVLVFFASWCVECRADLPVAARVAAAEARAGNRTVFLGIDGNDSPAAGWAFAQARGVSFPVADDQVEAVANQLKLTGLPSTAVVSASGRVVRRVTGAMSAAALEQAVAQVAPAHAVRPAG